MIHRWAIDSMSCKYGVVKVGFQPGKKHGSPYTIEVIDPIDFFIAPGYDDVWDAPLCGVRAQKPLSWIRENFPDVKIRGHRNAGNEDGTRAFKFSGANPTDSEDEFLRVTECWVRDDKTMQEITEENEEGEPVKVKKPKFPYGKLIWYTDKQKLGEEACRDNHGLPPYVILYDYERPHDFVGIGEVELLEGLQKDLNWILKIYSEFIRHYHNQNEQVDITGGFDIETYKRERTKGGQAFAHDSRGGTLPPPVQPIADPQIHPNMRELLQYIPGIAEEVSGVTDITKGQVGKSERQSASEIATLYETANTRIRQKLRNLEHSLSRLYYLFLRNVMQYQETPEYFSWTESEGRAYQMYGNSKAQADAIMRPQQDERLDRLIEKTEAGEYRPTPEEKQAFDEYKKEFRDYQMFLELFKEEGDVNPVYFAFDVEIQSDSTLPMDKQSRANLLLRLLSMAPQPAQMAMFELVLEKFQISDHTKVVEEMRQTAQAMMGGKKPQSPQDAAAAQQRPAEYQQYLREVGNG